MLKHSRHTTTASLIHRSICSIVYSASTAATTATKAPPLRPPACEAAPPVYVASSGVVAAPVLDGSFHALHVLLSLPLTLALLLTELAELVHVASGTLDHAVGSLDLVPDATVDVLETEAEEEDDEEDDLIAPSVHTDHGVAPELVCVELMDVSAGTLLDVVVYVDCDEDEAEAVPVLTEVVGWEGSVGHTVHEPGSEPDDDTDVDVDVEPERVVFDVSDEILLVPSVVHADHCAWSLDSLTALTVGVAVAVTGTVAVTIARPSHAEHQIAVVV